jgi:glycosyltransferase involved in cell wall biosynthesis
VSDDDLINLYSLARLFIFPSLHEGFGLPALEAMACGVPVVGSMTTSLPEVIGLKEALFDPESVESIQQTLAQGLTDEAYRQRLIEHAKVHVKKFNWDNSAKTALEALEKLHAIAPFLDEKPDLIEELSKVAKDTKPDTKALRLTANCIAYNQGAQQRQLLLDISTLVHNDAKAGTQRVVLSLISELFKLNPRELNIQPIYFTGGIYRYANAFCFEKFLYETSTGDTPVDFFQGDVYLSLDLNMHLSHETHRLHCDMRSRGLRIAYLVYDILVSQYPKWWQDEIAPIFSSWLKNIGDVATDLICISQLVATDVKSFYKQNPPNRSEQDPTIRSFHLGADLEKTLLSIGLTTSSGQMLSAMQERLSLLMVGTVEPRDDYLQALAVFELLWQRGLDINLVVVGMRGWLVDGCIEQLENHPQSMRKLFWLDSVNDEYLQIIYQAADCFIDASEGEDFGLPVKKAVQNGLPLIVRDLPFFREIAPEYAHFFQGHSTNDLVDAIEQWVKQHAKNLHPTTTCMKWLSRKESAAQLISLMDLN